MKSTVLFGAIVGAAAGAAISPKAELSNVALFVIGGAILGAVIGLLSS